MTYFLISVVSLVWGLLIWRLVVSISGDKVVQPSETFSNTRLDSFHIMPLDTEILHLNWRDPFLGHFLKKRNIKLGLVEKDHPIYKHGPILEEAFPITKYEGLIKAKNKTVAIILIQDHEVMMIPGTESAGVKVLSISKNSIIILYHGKKHIILKDF